MNKTIIINMNGIVFHIEEDAYEVLRAYMTEVKRHFAYSPDSDEIVTDIENRLAEMFNERLAEQGKQVIVLDDVTEITARMGSVADFDPRDEDEPYSEPYVKRERKLFRDPDDRVIGGVCAGLGHYFDMDAKWVRLITVAVTLLWGTGLIIYALLWIIMPEARSRADKMAMKGEPINLQNFKKNFDEELEAVRGNLQALHQSARPGMQKTADFLTEMFTSLGSFLEKALTILVKVIGGLIIFSGIMALLGIVIGLIFTFGFWDNTDFQTFPINVINPEYRSQLFLAAFLLIVIPLVALILFAMRVLFNKRVLTKTGSFAMLILWITGLGLAVFYGSKVGSEFQEDARFEQTTTLKPAPVLYLNQNASKFLTSQDSIDYNIARDKFQGRILIDDDDNEIGMATKFDLYIEKSTDGTYSVTKEFSARGKNFEAALKNAQNTTYRFTQTDSVLTFDKYFYINKKYPYRGQEVKVTLRVPESTRLIIDGDLNPRLHNYNLRDCLPEETDWKTPSEWVMSADGLKCNADSSSLHKQKQ
ncbi:PspC domain-containing protein [Arcticibacter sp. MXS-1]|uniref:PspC domain-containing protein n=1 Tax=Arcticibacter sp. MXS-1 TaxID=3341726 RepID=UPI0035A8E939